jgi:cytoskeletal protein RodZ
VAQSTPEERRSLVARRLAEKRQRARVIRKRVLAAGASTFVLAWGVIFVQLVAGHDPALAHKASTTTASSTASATPTSSSSGSTSSNASSSSSGSAPTSPVTTSQS